MAIVGGTGCGGGEATGWATAACASARPAATKRAVVLFMACFLSGAPLTSITVDFTRDAALTRSSKTRRTGPSDRYHVPVTSPLAATAYAPPRRPPRPCARAGALAAL